MNAVQQIRKLAIALIISLLSTSALADPLKVVASIKPVQALLFAVMGEDAQVDVLLPPNTSPHTFALKPSQAEMLQKADVVFWIGPELETSLQAPLKSLSSKARIIELLRSPDLKLLHTNGAVDPHVWVSPENVKVLVNAIRDDLSKLDPDNAKLYAKNAKRTQKRMKLLIRKATQMFAPTKDKPYIVQHDGLAYLAQDFGLNQAGYLQTMPGREPGAKHLSALRATIKDKNVRCLFVEPQFTSSLAQSLKKDFTLKIAEVDLMGTDLDVSPTLPLRIIQVIILHMDRCQYVKPKTETVQ